MEKILLASMILLSVGCASKPVTTSFDCATDCKTELANMQAFTSKFAYYKITKSDSTGFSASRSEQGNFNFRSGMVSNAYMNVWIEGRKVNVQAMNNFTNDPGMVASLHNAMTHDWQSEKVHPTERVVIDENGYVDQLFLNNRSY